MTGPYELVARRAEELVEEALTDTRVVVVNGARQAGKSTLTRTKDGVEVDAVIETPDGRVIGIEVKAGAMVRTEDLAGLRNLATLLGDRFVAGYVLYTGQQTLPFGHKLRAVPMDALWRLGRDA